MFQKRSYRNLIKSGKLVSFQVTVQETDLLVHTRKKIPDITRELVLKYRGHIEAYIDRYPDFVRTLHPWRNKGPAPNIIENMVSAAEKAGVGPMAAVAGAMAEQVGQELLIYSDEVIIENGGDVFIKTDQPVTVGIYAGESALSLTFGLRVGGGEGSVSVCTSSGRIGHSLSFGRADAVCAVSQKCALADASATAICNQVKTRADINRGIEFGKGIEGLDGIVIIFEDRVGCWGEIELVPLEVKKG